MAKENTTNEVVVNSTISLKMPIGGVETITTDNSTELSFDPTALVKIKAEYPKDYKGQKILVDGKIYEVGIENAKLFVEVKKIAKYAK